MQPNPPLDEANNEAGALQPCLIGDVRIPSCLLPGKGSDRFRGVRKSFGVQGRFCGTETYATLAEASNRTRPASTASACSIQSLTQDTSRTGCESTWGMSLEPTGEVVTTTALSCANGRARVERTRTPRQDRNGNLQHVEDIGARTESLM